jgi:hypothetical protein
VASIGHHVQNRKIPFLGRHEYGEGSNVDACRCQRDLERLLVGSAGERQSVAETRMLLPMAGLQGILRVSSGTNKPQLRSSSAHRF